MSEPSEKQKPTTDAYRENATRIFGEKPPPRGGRQRFVYTEGGKPLPEPIEVSEDWKNAAQSTGDLGKFEYNNLRSTDGVDISSRTKRREYMKAAGVTDASDFKEFWAKKKQQREDYFSGKHHDAEKHREAVARVAYQLESNQRKPRK